MKEYEEVKQYVKERLSEKRFYHSECVEKTCVELAKIYNADIEKARLVGIAHDVAKEMSIEEKIKYATKHDIKLDDVEIKSPELLHATIGAKICEEEFGFSQDMCEAIANHTTGKAGMDLLSKVLYISDSTSSDRKYEGISELNELAHKDIDAAIFENLTKTIKLLLEQGKAVHPDTVKARNEYIK